MAQLSRPHYGFVEVEATFCGLGGPTRLERKIASARHCLATLTVKPVAWLSFSHLPVARDSGFASICQEAVGLG